MAIYRYTQQLHTQKSKVYNLIYIYKRGDAPSIPYTQNRDYTQRVHRRFLSSPILHILDSIHAAYARQLPCIRVILFDPSFRYHFSLFLFSFISLFGGACKASSSEHRRSYFLFSAQNCVLFSVSMKSRAFRTQKYSIVEILSSYLASINAQIQLENGLWLKIRRKTHQFYEPHSHVLLISNPDSKKVIKQKKEAINGIGQSPILNFLPLVLSLKSSN